MYKSRETFGRRQTYLNPHMRIRETPAHIRHVTMIRARRAHEIRVLARPARVPRPQHRGAPAIAVGQRVEALLVRVDGAVVGVAVLGRVGLLHIAVRFGTGLELVGQFETGGETLLGRVAVGNGEGQARQGRCEEDLRDEHCG